MKKLLPLALAVIVALGVLIVVILDSGEDEESNPCVAPEGAGGGGSSANAEGLAEPMAAAMDNISSQYKSPDRPGHRGIDIAKPDGEEIYSMADGTVIDAGPATGFGNWVVVSHQIDGSEYTTVYGHMYAEGVHVSTGDEVKAGQHIADEGSDGESSGPHLHFEVWEGNRLAGGTEQDPTPWVERSANGESGGDDGGESGGDGESTPTPDDEGGGDTPAGGGGATNPGEDVPMGITQDAGTLDERQLDNVRAIIQVGKDRKADEKVIKAAVMAAGPESGYRMLASRAVPESLEHPNDGVTPGDATSVGLFQIKTPMNMPTADAMNREKHIGWFYDTADGVDTESKEAWEIAADVERPREDLRGKYAEWEGIADELLESEGDIQPSGDPCDPESGGAGTGGDDAPADGSDFGGKAVAAAREQIGEAYVWGGGDHNGPTKGGFDCSGLTMFAYAQASDGEVLLDHQTTSQMNSELLTDVDDGDIQEGDLVFFNGADDPQHMGIAVDDKTMVHAPETGDVVKEAPISDGGDMVSVKRLKEQN